MMRQASVLAVLSSTAHAQFGGLFGSGDTSSSGRSASSSSSSAVPSEAYDAADGAALLPQGNGNNMECTGTQEQIQKCDAGACDEAKCVDCAFGPWSDWMACNCEGLKERHRSIATYILLL